MKNKDKGEGGGGSLIEGGLLTSSSEKWGLDREFTVSQNKYATWKCLPSSLNMKELTQKDNRKTKMPAKRLCVTNVNGLSIASFVVIFTHQ